MIHLTFAFYLLALVAGTAAISQTFLAWQTHRKAVIRWYGLFLLALFLVLLYFLAELYTRIAAIAQDRATRSLLWIFQAAGSLMVICTAPWFYHSLLGLALPRAVRIAYFAVDAVAFIAAGIDLVSPGQRAVTALLIATLFGTIAYVLVLMAARLGFVGDPVLRRALALFLGLSLLFFPLMLIDSLLSYAPFLAAFGFIEGLSQPLYFLVLNCLTIVFGLKYMNRPAYADGNRLTEYFVAKFKVTTREQEIIRLLLEGATAKRIAGKLFVSPKTVENHVYNIYQKLGVGNRVQLYQLIRANARE